MGKDLDTFFYCELIRWFKGLFIIDVIGFLRKKLV